MFYIREMENRIEIDISGLTTEDIEEIKRLVEAKRQAKTNGSKAPTTNGLGEKPPPFPCSPLGKRLEEIRRQIEQSGMPMLSEEAFEAEIRARRGERHP